MKCLHALIDTGVVDSLINKPQTPAELVQSLGLVDVQFVGDVLRALSSDEDGWLDERADGTFAANDNTKALAGPLRTYFVLIGVPERFSAMNHIAARFKTGKIPLEIESGMTTFDFMNSRPALLKPFAELMSAMTRGDDVTVAAAKFHWGSFQHIVDIGGSQGVVLQEIHVNHPAPKKTNFDLQTVLSRCTYPPFIEAVAGDFFNPETIPEGADCYTMKSVLHDWNDAECVRILKNIIQRAKKGASIVVLDRMMPPFGDRSQAGSKWMGVWMGVVTTGRERTQADWDAVFEQAGLKIKSVMPLKTFHVIEAVEKASG